jgi:hypothetical protein
MNALLASRNWAIALVIALMLSTSYMLDGALGPDDIATEQAISTELMALESTTVQTAQAEQVRP